MADLIIDGFRFVEWPRGRRFLIIESDRLPECVAYCREKQIQWLDVTPSHGYRRGDLDFLHDCTHATGIFLMSSFADMSGLYALQRLTWLSAICRHEIDFAAFPVLADVATDWNPVIDDSLFGKSSLTRLWLRGYKSPSRTLQCLAALRNFSISAWCSAWCNVQSIRRRE